MTISSTAQSNAFNFLSFLQHSVDPRTGQYTLGIELPELVGNDLSGPSLPLRLAFNPMNDQDSGFGHGWSLNLSQYVPATNMLSLHTGDSFKVTGSGDQPDIRERKLETFHFHKDAAERFRVVHKSGLVEVLESRGPSTNRVALPTRVEAPSGHWIELSYGDYYGAPCLTSIIDGSGVKLLALSYSDGQVLIDLHPEAGPGGTPLARYQVKLDKRGRANKRLPFEVVLPSEDNASWRFEYEHFEDRNLQQLACLKTVHTPVGGTERIEYLDDGHRFPEAANPSLTPAPLPRVTRHVIEPGFDQPDMVTEYAYTTNNFLGRGATGVVWREDGEDNLYQFAGTGFSYGSTVSYLQAGTALRTVSRSFNRFHLLTLQRSEEAGCIEETETTYPEVEGRSFDQQPSYFQLPHKVLKRWKLASDQTKYREESLLNSYDIHGNLVEETQANGIRTTYAYYPSAGEQGKDEEGKPVELCPADPHGFVRTIKEMTIHPAAAAEGEAPTLRTRYRYTALAPLGQATQSSAWLVASEEDHLQVEAEQEILLRRTQRTYLDKPDTPFQHGRVDFQLETLRHGADRRQDKTSRTSYFYSLIKDDNDQQSLVQTKTTVQGHDLAQKSLYSAHSRYTGLHVRSQDLNGVYVHQRYDAMRRLVTQTIAPGTAFEASQHYQYNLSSAGQQPSQISTDVKGVRTRTWFDGYNRTLWEEREVEVEDTRTADAASTRQWFKVSETRYDSVGRTSAQVTYDHYQDRQLALTSRFEYDGWGDVCKTTGADGVIQRRERSPFGAEGDIIKTWQERANQPGVRQQLQVSEYNRFGKPLHDRRLDVDEQPAGSLEYYYDGLGRCVRDVRTLRDPLATRAAPIIRSQRYSYDVWGRMTRNERANGTSLVRHFASHTTNALTTRLELLAPNAQPGAGQTICARQFDGLERLSSLSVGPRTEQYTYQNEQVLVHTHTRASGRTYTFSYQPELTSQPTAISWKADAQAEFGYAKDDAAITRAKNPEGERLYTYTDQGFVSQEAWQGTTAADNYTIEHRMSVQGRPYQRSSSNGEQTLHTYDPQGRLKTTVQGNLHATFSYDDDGRLATTLTTDTASDRTVTCVQTYDSLGREHTRTLSLDDGTEQTLQLTWRDDDQLHQRSLHQGATLLLKETFQYDTLDRLTKVEYEGAELPCNAAGRALKSQQMRWDDLDNLTQCRSDFADSQRDNAVFTYATDGSFQLKSVTHSLQPDYQASQSFSYDPDGNMLNDEWGRALSYDDRGRLLEVRSVDGSELLARYRYDGHDHLLGVTHGNAGEVLRRYQGYRLSATVQGNTLTQYLYDGERPLGLQRHQVAPVSGEAGQGAGVDSRLLLTDVSDSVIGEYAEDGLHTAHYSVYGERAEDEALHSLLAFNGEVREQLFGWYLLGRGYRTYNPGLMRFHSPDSLDPEQSGLNPYLYALGNPVSWRDPSGHRAASAPLRDPRPPIQDPVEQPGVAKNNAVWIGVGLSALFILLSVVPIVGALAAGAAMTATMAIGLAGVALQTAGLGMQIGAILVDDPATSEWLTYAGMAATAIGGLMSGPAAWRGSQFLKMKFATVKVPTPPPSTPSVTRSNSWSSNFNRSMDSSFDSPHSTVRSNNSQRSSGETARQIVDTPEPDYDITPPPSPPPQRTFVSPPEEQGGSAPPPPPAANEPVAQASPTGWRGLRKVFFSWHDDGIRNGGRGTVNKPPF